MLNMSMERLSTGKRINSAKDDAAGLAIASSMTSQIRGMNQAVRNANDGISMAQTAEGGSTKITNMLQRVRELAVQSASGTYSDDDRTNLQAEVTELTAQITDILSNSKFNGVNLFDGTAGSSGTVTVQTGSDAADTVDLDLGEVDLDDAVAVDISDAADALGRAGDDRRRADHGEHRTRHARCEPEPSAVGRQQPDAATPPT